LIFINLFIVEPSIALSYSIAHSFHPRSIFLSTNPKYSYSLDPLYMSCRI
jgi:hypothetical protein